MWKKFPDSFFIGTVSGAVTLALFYFLLASVRSWLCNLYGNPYLLLAPRVQLFSIFLNILLFRFVMVKTDKEKSGKGMLLSTVGISFIYFLYYFKFHHSIIGS
ncbi:MAG: hypothetical protein NT126_10080 [Bacteroidetes bacterium]|nr:hypothetical protein [Bacteroidota bacterium]